MSVRVFMRRVRKLEAQCDWGGGRRCPVCEDGAKPSGLVFRVEGDTAAPEHSHPVCSGCGRCNPLIYDIVIAVRPAV